jgi:hypothetical protein
MVMTMARAERSGNPWVPFFTRDYDEMWESEIRFLPNNSLIRLWKDTGLYRGDGSPRPALERWRAALARPRR